MSELEIVRTKETKNYLVEYEDDKGKRCSIGFYEMDNEEAIKIFSAFKQVYGKANLIEKIIIENTLDYKKE